MSARSVVVVMPFGGQDRVERRRAILNFKRLEYLVRNKCEVTSIGSTGQSERVVYAVEVAKTAMGEIPEKALKQIDNADIVIALVAERNPNVVYEVAYRRTRDRAVILVVDSADNLPLYLTKVAFQNWRQAKILDRVQAIAADPEGLPSLPDFTVGIPSDLKETIDSHDKELARGLEAALQEIEKTFKRPEIDAVHHLRGIVSEETSSFYPCAIVEVSFARRGTFADPEHPALVTDFDARFSQLFGYTDKRAAEIDAPLTLDKLLARIHATSDKSDWDPFMAEQGTLTTTVIMNYDFARATVPMRFNDKHPHREYRGTAFLPCLVSQVIDGDLDGRHTMYLLVVYMDVTDTLRLAKLRGN